MARGGPFLYEWGIEDDSNDTGFVGVKARTLVFASDWSDSLGTGDVAVSNGNQWDVFGSAGPSARFEVVSTSGLDFPSGMDNVLRIRTRQEGPPFGRLIAVKDQFTELAIGETRYWRLYYRNDTVVDVSDGTHHAQMAPGAGQIWMWMQFSPDGTTVLQQAFNMKYDNTGGIYHHNWQMRTMSHNKTYRCEWAINRLAAEFCRLRVLRCLVSDTMGLFIGPSFSK